MGLQHPSVKRAFDQHLILIVINIIIIISIQNNHRHCNQDIYYRTLEGFIHMMELLLKSSHQILQVVSPTWKGLILQEHLTLHWKNSLSRSSLGRTGSSPPSSLCSHGTENMFGVLRTKIIRNWRDCYKTYKKVCQQ